MNGKRRIIVIALVLVAGLVALAPAIFAVGEKDSGTSHGESSVSARGDRWGDNTGRGHGGRDPLAKIELTADQRTRVDAIRAKYDASTEALRTQKRELREQIRAARESGDEARITALHEQAAPLHRQMKASHAAMRAEIDAILTAEQRAQLAAMRPEGRGRRGGCKGSKDRGQETRTQPAPSTGAPQID